MKENKKLIRLITWIVVGMAVIFVVGYFGFKLYTDFQQQRAESEKASKEQQTLLLKQREELAQTKREIEDQKNDSTNQNSIAEPSSKNNGVVPTNSILCNGKYWLNCPTGQQFECPVSGDANCIVINNQNTQSLQQECLTRGMQMVNEENNKYPSYTDLTNQKNALLMSLYPNSTRGSGETATITSEEYASLTVAQKSAVDSNNTTAIRDELDLVNVKLRVEDNRLSNLDDYLYMVRSVCGTVTTEQQIVHELQKIEESLNK